MIYFNVFHDPITLIPYYIAVNQGIELPFIFMKPATKRITHLIRQTINEVDDKAEVILFGSRARGEERKDSDWDILVLTDYPVNSAKERAFRYALCDLELETAESFSLFVYSKNEWTTKHRITPFFNSVSQEGVRL